MINLLLAINLADALSRVKVVRTKLYRLPLLRIRAAKDDDIVAYLRRELDGQMPKSANANYFYSIRRLNSVKC